MTGMLTVDPAKTVRCLVSKYLKVGDLGRLQVNRDRLFVLNAQGQVLADIDTLKE
jgi:hypothetical protein